MIATKIFSVLALALTATANPLQAMARQAQAVEDPCAIVRCMGGLTCQVQPNGQPKCVAAPAATAGSGPQCGAVTCAAGTECCNASCGICVEPGMACHQMFCEAAEPAPGPQCGNNFCPSDEFECCNESCGICVPKGGFCTTQICE